MNAFHATTALRGIPAEAVLDALLGHLREHDLEASVCGEKRLLEYEGARILFMADTDTLSVEISSTTQESLFNARLMAHYHLAEYAGCEPETIAWEGDQPEYERPPSFRVLTVTAVEDLTAQLRRVRFHGDDLARYERDSDIHCKLLLPQPGVTEPEWPVLGEDGLPRFPTGDKRLDMRTYTIRRIDAQAGWMEIDFVLHDDAGPGSNWAAQARPGQQIGLSGPGGRTARQADWVLLGGDETALPAIARIVDRLPGETRGAVVIEVNHAADELPLRLPPGMSLRWLHRDAVAPGLSTQLRDALLSCEIPPEGDRHVWVGAEFSTAQAVRIWLKNTVGLRGNEQLVVAYWRRGMDETRMKSGDAQPAEGRDGKAGE